jgi:hypothetical protein
MRDLKKICMVIIMVKLKLISKGNNKDMGRESILAELEHYIKVNNFVFILGLWFNNFKHIKGFFKD